MKTYRHKDFPELQLQISYEWHKEHRPDNYMLMFNRTPVLLRIHDSIVEDSQGKVYPCWILTYDSEEEKKKEEAEHQKFLEALEVISKRVDKWPAWKKEGWAVFEKLHEDKND